MVEKDVSGSYDRFIVKFPVIRIAAGIIAIFILFEKSWMQGNAEQCDLLKGEWIPNPSGPRYTNNTCNCIDDRQNCMMNGRSGTGYLYWRWKPYDCDVPPLDAEKFMNSMRDKSWVFIGDSILRNQMQSLTCLLSKVEEPVEGYHVDTYKSSTFNFPSYNLTIATIWSPFLVKYVQNNININRSNPEFDVYLDIPEEIWTSDYSKYDYIVIAAGQWYHKQKLIMWEDGNIIGCQACAEDYKEIGIEYTYRKALRTAFNFITSSDRKPLIFFRTWMPDHFEHGEWYNGGTCNRTQPYRKSEYTEKPLDQLMRNIEVEEFEKVVEIASEKGIHIELFDTFKLSLLRPDGHPGPYGKYHPFDKDKHARVQNDCLHSCLPGPIDTWNDVMMKIMLNEGIIRSPSSEHKFVI